MTIEEAVQNIWDEHHSKSWFMTVAVTVRDGSQAIIVYTNILGPARAAIPDKTYSGHPIFIECVRGGVRPL